MLTESQLIAKLKDTGCTTGFVMHHLGMTHMEATRWLAKQGAAGKRTAAPRLWKIGSGIAKQDAWNGRAGF